MGWELITPLASTKRAIADGEHKFLFRGIAGRVLTRWI